MAVRGFLLSMLIFVLGACAVYQAETVQKIALLAPFEGRYREIGYDALYAARLALSESGTETIDLLAIDDGGSLETAIDRANAIRQDETIQAVIVLGIYASDETVQTALENVPMLIVGNWGVRPSRENVFVLSNPEISEEVTWQGEITAISTEGEILGPEMLSLYQVPLLEESLSRFTILSSAALPDENFREVYLNMGLYVPEPNLLATLTYDATGMAIQSIQNQSPLSTIAYEGYNGLIHFENGYWVNSPIHRYRYDENGDLSSLPR